MGKVVNLLWVALFAAAPLGALAGEGCDEFKLQQAARGVPDTRPQIQVFNYDLSGGDSGVAQRTEQALQPAAETAGEPQ